MVLTPMRAGQLTPAGLITVKSTYRTTPDKPLMDYVLKLEHDNPGRKVAVSCCRSWSSGTGGKTRCTTSACSC